MTRSKAEAPVVNESRYLTGIRPSLEGEPQVETGADPVDETADERVVTEVVLDDVQLPTDGVVRFAATTMTRMKIVRPQISHAVVSQGSHSHSGQL